MHGVKTAEGRYERTRRMRERLGAACFMVGAGAFLIFAQYSKIYELVYLVGGCLFVFGITELSIAKSELRSLASVQFCCKRS